MTAPWTDEEGRLLRLLRERSGLDAGGFARRHAISVPQLAELEQGARAGGHFYSEGIKAHGGRNLLRRLGHVPPPGPGPAAREEPAAAGPAFADTVPSPLAPLATLPAAGRRPTPGRLTALTLAAVVAAAAAAAGYQLAAGGWPAPAAVAPPPAATSPPMAPLQPAAEESASAAPQPPAARAQAATPVAAAPAAPAGCEPAPGDAIAYTPPRASRPASYVYIEATSEVAVCVSDAEQHDLATVVRPGAGITVNGTAPFVVQTRQWGELKVFFQGVRVSVETPQPRAVVLHPR